MKASLDFDLEDLNDMELYSLVNQAREMYFSLRTFDRDLRSTIKYNKDKLSDKELKIYEKVRHDLRLILEVYGVDMEVLS